MIQELAADVTNAHLASAQNSQEDVIPTRGSSAAGSSAGVRGPAATWRTVGDVAVPVLPATAAAVVPVPALQNNRNKKQQHLKAFELDPLTKQYRKMEVGRIKSSSYFLDVTRSCANNKVHYLYIIVSNRFDIVKIGVTSLMEADLLKRYESAIGRVDRIKLFKINNGKRIHMFKSIYCAVCHITYCMLCFAQV